MRKLLPMLIVVAASSALAAPKPRITSPTTDCATIGIVYSYQITADQVIVTWGATPLPAGLSVNTATGLISGTPTVTGTFSINLSATNGNGTGNAILRLTINAAPTISSLNPPCATAGGPQFTLTVNGTNFVSGSTVNWNGTGLTTTFVSATQLSATVPFGLIANVGMASITVVNTTCSGATSSPMAFAIADRPVITSPLTACGTRGVAFSYTITATNNPTSFTASPLPAGLSVDTSTGVISGTPTTAGTTNVTITASSGGNPCNTASATLVITIGTTIGDPPVITSPLTATGQEGVAFSYTITATNTNNQTRYDATPLPPGLSVNRNTGVISGTPTAPGTAGQYSVTISVSNGAGGCNTASAILVITICQDDPSITSPLTASATLGSPFSYQIRADNGPISFDATDLPGGLTVDNTTGLISGTPTALGVFPVTISATRDPNRPCTGTATDTLMLTVTLPGGVSILPFPGQVNVFNWGATPPGPNDHIPFPNPSTNNYFVLYWNAPGSNTNQAIADSANGGLQRNADTVGMRYNPYNPTLGTTPSPDLNVWRGNPMPPNDNTSGQFGDPRASWYITDPWPTADYITGSYWGGRNPNITPLNWPDSGHNFGTLGFTPQQAAQANGTPAPGQLPPAVAILPNPSPTPDPDHAISLLSSSTSGSLASVTELGNVWDPAQLSYTVVNPGGSLPDIPTSALRDSRGAGGHTFAIGRPEFSMFDQNGMRAWQLLDVFSGKTSSTNFTNTAGLVNINTASRDVLRSLAAGILENRDPAIQPPSLQNNLYSPTATGANIQQADLFADAVINSRPLLSTSALSAIRDSQGQPFFGNPNQYNGSTQAAPTEWNDPGREELFAKIYNLATTRSRNFRVFVTGQSLNKNGNVLSTVTKVYHVFIKPNRDPATGAIQSQQVQIKYEGSM
jgi:hypothetical protein